MANIIIKSDEQREREKIILRDFGCSSNASAEEKEYAETAARRIEEAYEKMEAMQR